METISVVKVNDVNVQIVSDKNIRLVPIRPICEALGIDDDVQNRKLKDDDFLSSVTTLSVATGSDGKQYEMVCLPLEFIFGWLFTINPKNVKIEARDTVAKYRIECYRALYIHFTEQYEFIQEKQRLLSSKIEKLDTLRNNFKNAEKQMKHGRMQLYRVKDFTFEEWKSNNRQMFLFDEEG